MDEYRYYYIVLFLSVSDFNRGIILFLGLFSYISGHLYFFWISGYLNHIYDTLTSYNLNKCTYLCMLHSPWRPGLLLCSASHFFLIVWSLSLQWWSAHLFYCVIIYSCETLRGVAQLLNTDIHCSLFLTYSPFF